jgi:hypothetical protein
MKRKTAIVISFLVIVILIFNINLSNNQNNVSNLVSVPDQSSYYLNHNISIGVGNTLDFNDMNISILKNMHINSFGNLSISHSIIEMNNNELSLNICGGSFILNNSKIDINGTIFFKNSNILICNSSISNNSFLSGYNDNIKIVNSTVSYKSLDKERSRYCAGQMFPTSSYPLEYGKIAFKPFIKYKNSYVKSIKLSFRNYGDINISGVILFYEHGSLLENYSIPIHEGNYFLNTTLNLSKDLLPYQFQNMSDFYMEIPEGKDNLSAGNDKYLAIKNLTVYMISNDTENFYGINKYNIVFQNSTIISINSKFNTNFKSYYIYQGILNPIKNQ